MKEAKVWFHREIMAEARVTGVVYVDMQFASAIECGARFSPIIECDKTFRECVEIPEIFTPHIVVFSPFFIPCIIQLSSEIFIPQIFNLTNREFMYMVELVGDPREQRMQKIARYYFTMRASIKEISEILGVGKSQVYEDIASYKQEVLKGIKKDLRQNKKILGHMVELMTQLDNQTRTIWDKFNQLEADSAVYRSVMRHAEDRIKKGEKIENFSQVTDAMKIVFMTHDRQQVYLSLAKEQTKAMFALWKDFGLTGDEAVKLVLSGGVDVDVKVQEIRQTIVKLFDIIKFEVSDIQTRKNIFGRLANEIKSRALTQKDGEEIANWNN